MTEESEILEALRGRVLRGLEALRGASGWVIGVGAVLIVLGVLALGSQAFATLATVTLVGVAMCLAGLVEIVHGFRQRGTGRAPFWVLLGALYLVCGILVLRNPTLAAGVLTLMLGAGLAASGIVRIALAFQVRQVTDAWGWLAASGAATLLLGLVVLLQWPASSLTILGLLLGIDLLFAGFGWVRVGLGLRRLTGPVASA
ncbi:HdeD family acid-resistance protein [Phenylobacterium parvum]|uniref:HdeD family acid-resistance protein n=1 Tax=Phenylobacterium parvum TaxID=2201350 RepID=UPI0018EFFB1C|nr:DUF308 domain-containing protein [Phenylobacterium parvum]